MESSIVGDNMEYDIENIVVLHWTATLSDAVDNKSPNLMT